MHDSRHPSESAHPRPAALRASSLWLPPEHSWRRLPVIGLILAVVGFGGSLALGLAGGGAGEAALHQLWHSWLVGALFVVSIALGGLFFVLVHHGTQAGWSVVVRRISENVMVTLPFLALLFLPLLLDLDHLFHHWTHPAAADHLLAHKAPYLNVPFFVIRTVAYFAIWSALALWFGRQSRLQDQTGDHELTRRMRRASAPGLILFALTTTFFAFDWLMSLDPHWYSTIFGVYFFAGSVMAFFAFLSLVVIAGRRAGLLTDVLTSEHQQDIGKLLFAFVVFWAYMAFSQYMLIWYANLPEETSFFALRQVGSWRAAGIVLALGHFVVPFFFLLPRAVKRSPKALAAAAVWLLAMHLLDLYWLVMPNLHRAGMAPSLLDAAAVIGCCGLFLAAFGVLLKRQALVPLRDPRLPESLTFENV